MKIVVDQVPKCSSDCIFSRYLSCERRRCILTDSICALDNDIPHECHKLVAVEDDAPSLYTTAVNVSISEEELIKTYKYIMERTSKRYGV